MIGEPFVPRVLGTRFSTFFSTGRVILHGREHVLPANVAIVPVSFILRRKPGQASNSRGCNNCDSAAFQAGQDYLESSLFFHSSIIFIFS